MRIATVDMRGGATISAVLNAIAAEFPTASYPPLSNGNWELFRDILADWMLKNWQTWLEVEVLLMERDCREQVTLLHDIAAAFEYAKHSAIRERLYQAKKIEVFDDAASFVLRMYVFRDS